MLYTQATKKALIRLYNTEIFGGTLFTGDILGKQKNVWFDKNHVKIGTIRVDTLINIESTGLTELYLTVGELGCGYIRLTEKGKKIVEGWIKKNVK